MERDKFNQYLKNAKASDEYRIYLEVRDRVLDLMDKAQDGKDSASDYWKEELSGFYYMLDASPLIIEIIREHCYHLTGIRSYEYREHHNHKSKKLRSKLSELDALEYRDLFVPESPVLGGFGFDIDGRLVNVDTLKFYETLIGMDKAGCLDPFRDSSGDRRVMAEIGSGWGGFAYQFKTLFPDSCVALVDLPQTLLFSAVYIKSLFPEAKSVFMGEVPDEELFEKWSEYDFIFLPHYVFDNINSLRIDLAVNMVSFQEMTSEHVEGYAKKLSESGCPTIYSHNRDRSPHNKQLSTVSSILSKYYDLEEIKLLDSQYTQFLSPNQAPRLGIISFLKKIARLLLRKDKGGKGKSPRSVHDYRHFVARLK